MQNKTMYSAFGAFGLAVCLMGMTGCAYFEARDGELYVSSQMAQNAHGKVFMVLPEPNTIGAALMDVSVVTGPLWPFFMLPCSALHCVECYVVLPVWDTLLIPVDLGIRAMSPVREEEKPAQEEPKQSGNTMRAADRGDDPAVAPQQSKP